VGDRRGFVERLRAAARREEAGTDDHEAVGEGGVADLRGPPAMRKPVPTGEQGDQRKKAQIPHGDPKKVQIPHGVEVASAWSWRFLVIVLALIVIVRTLLFFELLLVPVVVAVLICALVIPTTDAMASVMPRGVAAMLSLLGVIAVVAGLLALVGQQLASGFDDLATQVSDALGQIQDWLRTGPLHISQTELDDAIAGAQAWITSDQAHLAGRLAAVGATLGHVVAGFFIVLFTTYFLLYQGELIWTWIVRLFPRATRELVDGSGRAAWVSLTAFVRATVVVAFIDAVGITLVALVLRVPLAVPIGILVFLGSFVPIVGATVSGSVAVLVALVAHGPLIALFMLVGVIAVQQVEAHVLQPFLMGHAVSLHPLAVILVVSAGVVAAGIVGALVAVPVAAMLNTIVKYVTSAGRPFAEPHAESYTES
jgi:predicted PurR-regulated permease PerM